MNPIETDGQGGTVAVETLHEEWKTVWSPLAQRLALQSHYTLSDFASAVDRLRKMGISPEKTEEIMKAAMRWDVHPDALSMAVWVIHHD